MWREYFYDSHNRFHHTYRYATHSLLPPFFYYITAHIHSCNLHWIQKLSREITTVIKLAGAPLLLPFVLFTHSYHKINIWKRTALEWNTKIVVATLHIPYISLHKTPPFLSFNFNFKLRSASPLERSLDPLTSASVSFYKPMYYREEKMGKIVTEAIHIWLLCGCYYYSLFLAIIKNVQVGFGSFTYLRAGSFQAILFLYYIPVTSTLHFYEKEPTRSWILLRWPGQNIKWKINMLCSMSGWGWVFHLVDRIHKNNHNNRYYSFYTLVKKKSKQNWHFHFHSSVPV